LTNQAFSDILDFEYMSCIYSEGENSMKKIVVVLMTLLLVMAILGCASKPAAQPAPAGNERNVPAGFPDFVKKAVRNAPEDALVGIGTAKLASLSQSRTVAGTRARAEISRQLNTIVQDMVRDYQASSEVDPGSAISFQENMTVALSKSTLTGSKVVDEDVDSNGNVWAVVYLEKSNVASEINQAQAAAKLAVPAMASFNAEARMNEAFGKLNSQEMQVGNK
jgi:hypothetical protein